MSKEPHWDAIGPPPLALFAQEQFRAAREFASLRARRRALLSEAPRGDGHPVLVLPGFLAPEFSTAPLRSFLRQLCYDARSSHLRFNLGPSPKVSATLQRRLKHLADRHGRRVSLVGWSLGGIYARELARAQPELVRGVVTMGTPFADISATHAARFIPLRPDGKPLHQAHELRAALRRPLPVPTTSIYSKSDGIVHWQGCLEQEGPTRENVEVHCSHTGMGFHPDVFAVVADRLAQAEGEWRAYQRAACGSRVGWKGILIDLDGVLYQGGHAVPGAADAVAWIAEREIPHLFLTNTTSRPRAALVEKLAGFDVPTTADAILSPPVAADRWLSEHAPGPAALFVPAATADEFRSVSRLPEDAESGAASVVVGDLGDGWSFPVLNRAFRLLMEEPRPALVALGMTRYWRAPDGLRLDVAAFVKALEHATGLEAEVLGKPARAFYETALASLGCAADEAVMIGDDVVGDVGGAQRAGLSGVLVRTGKFRPDDESGEIRPDAVLDSIADLPDWWQAD